MTLKTKIIIITLCMGLVPMSVIAALTFLSSYRTAENQGQHSLMTMHEAITTNVDDYFKGLHSEVRLLAANPQVIQASQDFTTALAGFDPARISIDDAKMTGRYKEQATGTKGATDTDALRWSPKDPVTRALQALYISQNPHATGQKHELVDAGDGSSYSTVHARYHPFFRNLVAELKLYDVFLVDIPSGRITYSMYKEVDFLRDVKDPLIANSGLSEVVTRIVDLNKPDVSVLSDFSPYIPSYNSNAAFLGSGIFDGGKLVGVVVVQVPLDEIVKAMKSATLLGETSDAYVLDREGRFLTKPYRLDVAVGDFAPKDVLENLKNTEAQIVHYEGSNGAQALSATGLAAVPFVSHRDDTSELEPSNRLPWAVSIRIEDGELLAGLYKQMIQSGIVLGLTLVAVLVLAWVSVGQVMRPISRITSAVAVMNRHIRDQTITIRTAIDSVVAAAEETSHQAVFVRQNSQRAAESSSSVAAAVEEMDASIAEISHNMSATDHKISDTRTQADEASAVMLRLEDSAAKIAEVLTLISDIAARTNLLALNAAIEAARAGDAGRGFAVVADEVKKLAENTITATEDIRSQVEAVKTTSTEAAYVLSRIRDAVSGVQENASAVSSAVSQQSSATGEISQRVQETVGEVKQVDLNMAGIEEAAQNTGSSANEMLTAVRAMEEQFNQVQVELDATLATIGLAKGAKS